MADLDLTILMPCLNEAETLAACIRRAKGFIARSGLNGEVLIADNGSTDGSSAIAEAEGARVVIAPRKGYGAALAAGIGAARGRWVVMGDADGSYDFGSLDSFVAALRDSAQLVMGNRFSGGIKPGAMPPLHRYFGNPVLSFAGRLFFRSPVGDFHCGLRGFDRNAILALNLRTTGMEFASEMVVKSTLSGLRIAEVPTVLSPDGRSRRPHLRSFRDGWRHLRFLLLFSPKWLFLYPGYLMLALGLFLGALLIGGPVRVSPSLVLDVHTFLVAAMLILVGLQAVSFAVIARRFATRYGLMPPSPTFEPLFRALTLERVLAAALLLMAIGAGALLWGVVQWAERGFGDLDPSDTMRTMILSLTGVVAGLQLMLAGFLNSMVDLPIEEGRLAAEPEPGRIAAKTIKP